MNGTWRAELIGTFGIVFAPCALAASGKIAGGDPSLLAAALVSGLSVTAMIHALGRLSEAHFNPAVTLALASVGRFPMRSVPGYLGAQALGSLLAALTVRALFGGGYGAHVPMPGALWRPLSIEILITGLLMLVIMAVATAPEADRLGGLAIGVTVVVGVLLAGPVTGGSMNPARSLGPALVARGTALEHYWIYAAGPCVGAFLAAHGYEILGKSRNEKKREKRVR